MCLLTYFPSGSTPDMAHLEAGADYNPDGHGYAIITADDRLVVYKGMDADTVLLSFETMRALNPEGPALFHSRIGTAGTLDDDNCHPFHVGTDSRTVIAHNGVLPHKAQPAKGDLRSDTRLLAEVFLPKHRFGAIHTPGGRKSLGNWAGRHNKFVVLTVNPEIASRQGNGFIVNESSGDWEEGPSGPIWYSNSSHDRNSWYHSGPVSGPIRYAPKGAWLTDDDGVMTWRSEPKAITTGYTDLMAEIDKRLLGTDEYSDECPFCGSRVWMADFPNLCSGCWGCKLCFEDLTDCECWRDQTSESDYVNWWAKQVEGW